MFAIHSHRNPRARPQHFSTMMASTHEGAQSIASSAASAYFDAAEEPEEPPPADSSSLLGRLVESSVFVPRLVLFNGYAKDSHHWVAIAAVRRPSWDRRLRSCFYLRPQQKIVDLCLDLLQD